MILIFLLVVTLPLLPTILNIYGINLEALGAFFYPQSREKWLSIIYYPFALFVLGFSVVRWVVRPNIIIRMGHIDYDGVNKFFHACVINLNWPPWFFLFRKDTANNVSSKVIYRKRLTNEVVLEIDGRWTRKRQPEKVQDIWDSLARYINISPSKNMGDVKEGIIDIGVAVSGQKAEFYAFNEQNYLVDQNQKDVKFPGCRRHYIPYGDYEVEVKVYYGESTIRRMFNLAVRDSLDNTCFEEKY